MKLTSGQLNKVREWAAGGASISEIQKRMESDFDLRMTYMELRFLLDDYSIEIGTTTPPARNDEPMPDAAAETASEASGAETASVEAQDAELAGGVTVDADPIARPGALLSGGVVFSDGVKARWSLDQYGRLGLDGVDKSYRPSDEDVRDFQSELQRILQKKGY
jgi:hypothetical protein